MSGFSKDNIQSYSETYDKQTIKKYSDFMSFLNSEKLSIGVKWCNMGTQTKYSHKIEIDDTQKILSNLSNFDFDNEEELKVIGRFYSLNVKTGSYSFESTEGDDFKSTGFLDEQRKQIAFSISFNKTYQIIINRKVKEPVGRKQIIKDTIISFIEEEDN